MGEQNRDIDQLFGETCRQEIGNILGVLNDECFPAFWDELKSECLKINRGISTSPNAFKKYAPFDASLTQRMKWLNTNILRPIQRLESSLVEENKPHFHHWEDYGESPVEFSSDVLNELTELRTRTESLASWLQQEIDGETAGKISHTNEIRSYIVFVAIDTARKHFPNIKMSRGNWDDIKGMMIGRTQDYVRAVFQETTGYFEFLDNKISDFV
ncbi:hypothetical protein O4H47_13545 [Maritalea porphyrae]|nr:hypothetical protein [Maritalea porphyrae]